MPLPSGLPDILPPLAAAEFRAIHHLLKGFMGFGYAPVIPPLAEFEASLLAGDGAATARQSFRVMDPLSRDMLAIRADITTQISRIATSSLRDAPRPLRLCYAGYTLRTNPEPLQSRRQHTQIGLELFGASQPSHDAEVIAVAATALAGLSLTQLSLDLSAPALLPMLLPLDNTRDAVLRAVSHKDASTLRAQGQPLLAELVEATGPSSQALPKLKAIAARHLPLTAILHEIEATIASLSALGLTLPVTVDLLEPRGFGYYSGLAYALYLREPALEIGRGGRYSVGHEEAAGFTFYIDDVLQALPEPQAATSIGVPAQTPAFELESLQSQGFTTVLLHSTQPETEAKTLGLSHVWLNRQIVRL
jgi:ATP phosphoribosyltransferase regulatory subunit